MAIDCIKILNLYSTNRPHKNVKRHSKDWETIKPKMNYYSKFRKAITNK